MSNEIPEYINNWLSIIENMSNDNTYKLAWGRSILECISFELYSLKENKYVIKFTDIAECIIKYYRNQQFFFSLKQSPYIDKDPIICTGTNKLIKAYKDISKSNLPVWYDKGIEALEKECPLLLNQVRSKIAYTLNTDVAWRFKIVNSKNIEIYTYDKHNRNEISFNSDAITLLKEYNYILAKLLNFKWTQLLEKFNHSPRIAMKVNGISEAKLRRNSLARFKKELLKEFENGKIIDFYTGLELKLDEISIDHVIPWSFMYSDDIWNLVITSKNYNSSKSNSIPTEEMIEKLKDRNNELINRIAESYSKELSRSIEGNYVENYFYDCKV
ncbi:MAG: HNH endonuclease domain-containing protein [Bacilli bacterium]